MDMRVAGVNSAYGVYSTSKTANGKKADVNQKAEASKDLISLSESAEDYQSVRNALQNVPDFRADTVSRIKAQIDAGLYQVSASEVADRILKGL